MKKFILLILFVYSFAVNDYLIRPNTSKVLYSEKIAYSAPLTTDISSDEYNVYLYNDHFRVIFGKEYNDSDTIRTIAEEILQISTEVWDKEIVQDGFKAPKNSDKNYIDIYIANTDAYNYESGSYVTISSQYAGYATAYTDGTPFFVINPYISDAVLEVTIAHEFFHTVQYAYGLYDVSNDMWYKNLWFLEATATMMEDEVFNDVNDYVNYLSYYLPYTYFPLEYYNGGIEYGKVLFAKYMRDKYGIDFIKSIFENYENTETILQDIKNVFENDSLSFDSFMMDYGVCLNDLYDCFPNENITQKPSYFSLEDNVTVYNYGLLFVTKGDNYLISSTPVYLQENFNGEKDIIDDISDDGLIVLNKTDKNLFSSDLENNYYQPLNIRQGWNLISNYTKNSINLSDLGGEIVWVYRNGRYYGYSNNEDIENLLKNEGYATDENVLYPQEGAWIYANSDYQLDIPDLSLLSFNDISLVKGWNLISCGSDYFNLSDAGISTLIWSYDNGWQYYDNDLNIDGAEKFYYVKPGKGYFIYNP